MSSKEIIFCGTKTHGGIGGGEAAKMKAGDLVRTRRLPQDMVNYRPELGILIEYNTWEKVATVLMASGLIRIRAEHVEKAGKKDVPSKDL